MLIKLIQAKNTIFLLPWKENPYFFGPYQVRCCYTKQNMRKTLIIIHEKPKTPDLP